MVVQYGRRADAYLPREGSGPVLVCHAGGPGFSSLYFGDLAGLAERFTLVLLNPRGTGGSDRPADARAYRVEDYVADVEELRAHLGLVRLLLFGLSHGVVVAQAYAARHPERVERLVLASTLAPTLVIAGEEDFIAGPVCAREIAGAIPNARAILLPGVGHFIFVEAPERFRAELETFLL